MPVRGVDCADDPRNAARLLERGDEPRAVGALDAGRPPVAACGARALFDNAKEAQILTGCEAPRVAAERLSA